MAEKHTAKIDRLDSRIVRLQKHIAYFEGQIKLLDREAEILALLREIAHEYQFTDLPSEKISFTEFPSEEIEIEVYPPRQIGGQHVGTGPNGIKMTHIPSGLTAIADNDRSQHRNRAIASDMLMGGLTSPHYRGSR